MCCRAFAAKERRKFANLEETEEAAAGEVGLRHVVGERRRYYRPDKNSRFKFQIPDSEKRRDLLANAGR